MNLLLLGYYKYSNFFIENLNAVTGSGIGAFHRDPAAGDLVLHLHPDRLPGRCLSRHRGSEPRFAHYAAVRHLLSASDRRADPASRRDDAAVRGSARPTGSSWRELRGRHRRSSSIGLFKKTVLADGIAPYVDPVFARGRGRARRPRCCEAWGGALAYTFQLYFDFSGYSDMAIGLSRMFGMSLPLNFDSPYKAPQHHRFLAPLAHDAVALPARLPLHSARRQPQGPVRRYANLIVDDAAGRPVARRRLDLRGLGAAAWPLPGHPSHVAGGGAGLPARPLALRCWRGWSASVLRSSPW